jgi:hypothetical protein
MVNVDISKVLPSRPYAILADFLPGIFFEVSILLANPEFIRGLTADSQRSLAISPYLMLIIALFLAFAIGNGFMQLVMFVQYLLGYLYRFWNSLWKQLCKWPLRPLSTWLLKKPRWRHPVFVKFNRYLVETGYELSGEWKKIQGCWHVLARQLLKTRYGIEPEDVKDDEWEVLYWTLGTPTIEDMRGSLMMIATHATGWSGLAAARIAPALQNRYYLGFCIFLVLTGLLNNYYVVVSRNDPHVAGYINVRALLREFRKERAKNAPPAKPNPDL